MRAHIVIIIKTLSQRKFSGPDFVASSFFVHVRGKKVIPSLLNLFKELTEEVTLFNECYEASIF